MLSLIITILFSLEIAYFALQNTTGVPLRFVDYQLDGIPMYIVVISSILIGVLMSWFISALDSASNFFKIRSKDSVIRDERNARGELERKIHDLELENAKLRGDRKELIAETSTSTSKDVIDNEQTNYKPSFFERIFSTSPRRYSKQI